jgi:glyceraldehyde 3-phosphate dehydrogenase
MNIGINGFGRIGRAIFRLISKNKNLNVSVINDINPDIKNICYTLQYDSIHGKFKERVYSKNNVIIIGNKKIKYFSKKKINEVNWKKYNIDILIDASGILENVKILSKKKNICDYSIITHATYNQPKIKTLIFGINDENFNFKKHKIISSSICDTVAFSPIYKLIDENFKIINGNLTTLHPWLPFQNLLDGKSASWSVPGDTFSQYALGRSAVQNLIPKSTSAVNAAELVIPKIKNKLKSLSFRVPTNLVSGSVLNLNLKKKVSLKNIKNLFEEYEKKQKWNILKISYDPITSLDFIGEEFSLILDDRWTSLNKQNLQIVFWYDNEVGYSSKVIDIIKKIKISKI